MLPNDSEEERLRGLCSRTAGDEETTGVHKHHHDAQTVYAFSCFFVLNALYSYTVGEMKLLMPLMAQAANTPNHYT